MYCRRQALSTQRKQHTLNSVRRLLSSPRTPSTQRCRIHSAHYNNHSKQTSMYTKQTSMYSKQFSSFHSIVCCHYNVCYKHSYFKQTFQSLHSVCNVYYKHSCFKQTFQSLHSVCNVLHKHSYFKQSFQPHFKQSFQFTAFVVTPLCAWQTVIFQTNLSVTSQRHRVFAVAKQTPHTVFI